MLILIKQGLKGLSKFSLKLSLIGFLLIVNLQAREAEFTGFIAFDYRQFFQKPEYDQSQKFSADPSIAFEPEYYYVSDDEKFT